MELFDSFAQQVCRQVRHATPEERADIARELREHMEDRAEALCSAGTSEEEAAAQAVEAMGDPEAIGRELNRCYPLRYLILSRLSGALLLLFFLYAIFTLPGLYIPYSNLSCRLDPTGGGRYMSGAEPEEVFLTDYRWTIGSSVLRLYGIQPDYTDENGVTGVRIFLCVYNKNPFRYASEELLHSLYVLDESGQELTRWMGNSGNVGAYYCNTTVPVEEGAEGFRLCYDRHGFDLDAYISLPGEEEVS